MAGWKLRKDKTQSETADAEAPGESSHGAEIYAAPTEEDAEPASRWEMPEEDWRAPAAAIALAPAEDEPETEAEAAYPQPKYFDLSGEPLASPNLETAAPEIEVDEPLHFAEEEEVRGEEDPLVLVDYSEPAPLPAPPAVPAPLAFEPAPLAFEPAPLTATLETGREMDGITSTLRMERSELAAALPTPPAFGAVPPVAPFVLDLPPAAPPAEAAHRLVMRVGRLSAAFELAKAVTTIGRPDSALHFYPDVEIELDDAVSRRHAEVLHREGDFYVVDTGSTNGTMLNGELLPPHEERLLAHGDRIRVGERTELIFE